VVIDAAQSPSDVAESTLAAIVGFYSLCIAKRFGLGIVPFTGTPIKAKAPSHP
jgi:hypothetical protein